MNSDTLQFRRLLALPVVLAALSVAASGQQTQPPPPAAPPESAPAEEKAETETGTLEKSVPAAKILKLETYEVLGSRIRRTEAEGPSPVNTYDREYIRSTGAMNLADFLNYLPQTYNGIGAGRGSTPNELNPEFGQRTETSSPLINFVLGASDAPPGQTGVSGVSLRGLGAGSTLVLVDGRRAAQSGAGNRSTDSRQGFVDLNTIPLGMVDHVEVITDGASAIYGADAVAGVINIVLKKDWKGTELSGSYRGTFHGGGRERQVTLVTGFAQNKLRGTVAVDYYDRAPLKASQRRFSKNQDHRGIIAGYDASGNPIFGRDLRLNWGYPAVVQAQGGTVAGNFDAIPGVRVVLVPVGAAATPAVGQFIPVTVPVTGTVVNASGQRRGNTSEFLDIIPQSERYGFSGNFTYTLSPQIEFYGTYSYADTRGLYATQPGVSSASASSGFGNFSTLVPAALNPFNQNVIVGMVHYEFGSVTQRTHTKAHKALFAARGKVGHSWEWDSGIGWQRGEHNAVNRAFNSAAITAALNNPDASQRLNPFIDARAATTTNHQAIYEKMAIYPVRDTLGEMVSWDFAANGGLFDIWGGTVSAAVGAAYEKNKNSEEVLNYTVAATPVASTAAASGSEYQYAAFAELAVPIVGKPNALPGIRRLELQLAGRYEEYERAGNTTVPKIGFTWVPVRAVLFRGSYSEGFRAPDLTEYEVPNTTSTGNTVLDPRRNPATTTGVSIVRGSNANPKSETSETEYYGVVVEPPFAKGLNFQIDYYRTTQRDVIQVLTAQTVVNNESLFGSRVVRAPADATDVSLNQPGRITSVDLTFVNFGRVRNESVDFTVDYRLPWEQFGRWRVGLSATRTLKSTRELAPGQPPIVDDDGTFAPPEWKYNGSVFWTRNGWNASAFISFIDGFLTNPAGNTFTTNYPIPSLYKVDVRGGYEFKHGVWRGHGKGLRILGGIANVFDEEPPFSDTVFGYNGGLHGAWAFGRSYELSFVLPF
ncbi:MAG: TonB-dependent receptor [Opitutaceae bacterium]|nr:TonB-dependent receptor [Opitutaceae bacterium]